jgi:hypothetical protein
VAGQSGAAEERLGAVRARDQSEFRVSVNVQAVRLQL